MMKRVTMGVGVGVAVLLAMTSVSLATIEVKNFCFETPPISPNSFGAPPTNWTIGGNAGLFYPTQAQWNYEAPFGNQLVYINGGGSATQVTDDLLTAGTKYTLVVAVVHRPGFFSTYKVELKAGDTVIAVDNDTLDPPVGGYLDSTITYTAAADDPLAGQPLTIRLSGGTQANFDNVRLFIDDEVPGVCTLDMNCDGVINSPDLNILLADFGCTANCNADLSGDGAVTSVDLNMLLADFGQNCFE
jgi:hypothetical protein